MVATTLYLVGSLTLLEPTLSFLMVEASVTIMREEPEPPVPSALSRSGCMLRKGDVNLSVFNAEGGIRPGAVTIPPHEND